MPNLAGPMGTVHIAGIGIFPNSTLTHSYGLFTLGKPRSPLGIHGERGFLEVNRLFVYLLEGSAAVRKWTFCEVERPVVDINSVCRLYCTGKWPRKGR